MEIEKGTPVLWYDTIGHIPIRVGIPIVLTAPEAKAALEEFVGFLAELAAVPDADKMTFGEAYKLAIEERDKTGRLPWVGGFSPFGSMVIFQVRIGVPSVEPLIDGPFSVPAVSQHPQRPLFHLLSLCLDLS